MSNFTPIASFLGGLLIGLSASLLWLANGRIAGISGILGNLSTARSDDVGWRLAFLAGLVLSPMLYAGLFGVPTVRIDTAAPAIIAGGLLVGVGTRLGGGCTSGHGVCGLARLSPRSLAATLTFMVVGFLTVFVLRHLRGG